MSEAIVFIRRTSVEVFLIFGISIISQCSLSICFAISIFSLKLKEWLADDSLSLSVTSDKITFLITILLFGYVLQYRNLCGIAI